MSKSDTNLSPNSKSESENKNVMANEKNIQINRELAKWISEDGLLIAFDQVLQVANESKDLNELKTHVKKLHGRRIKELVEIYSKVYSTF